MLEIIIALGVIAVVLGILAAYHHYTDPATIDEEEEEAVAEETPEEHARALAEERQTKADQQVDEMDPAQDEDVFIP